MSDEQFEEVAASYFGLSRVGLVRSFDGGKINLSAAVTSSEGRFVVQKLNTVVFPDPHGLLQNFARIVEQLKRRGVPGIQLRESTAGDAFVALDGEIWRCYSLVAGTPTPPILSSDIAQVNARAFGRYAKAIAELDLVEHVAGYHDFDAHVTAFEHAVKTDEFDRAERCVETIARAIVLLDRLRLSSGYRAWSELPTRNVHNDAKGPNCILGPDGTHTVIDLDTTMPGTILSDVGELVRSSTRHVADRSPATIMAQIEAVNRGFLAGYGQQVSESERNGMLLAGPLLTIENALRFLTDHLSGDVYYSLGEPGDNLARGIEQLDLADAQIDAIEWVTVS